MRKPAPARVAASQWQTSGRRSRRSQVRAGAQATALAVSLHLPRASAAAFVEQTSGPHRCPLRPKTENVVTWEQLLAEHAKPYYSRALIFCAPAATLERERLGVIADATAAIDIDVERAVQGVRAAHFASRHAALVGTCVLLLPAEVAHRLLPQVVSSASEPKAFPAVLFFNWDPELRHWRAHARQREEIRRMNGCGIHAECFLLDLARLARASGDAPAWASLETPWPGLAQLPPSAAFTGTAQADAFSSALAREHRLALRRALEWPAAVAPPVLAPCLRGYIDEVVRFRPAEAAARVAPSNSFMPALIVHHISLELRKRLMRRRLLAAGLASGAHFVEMRPDNMNDTMRHCLGPLRRQSMDSMSDNPGWRLPTRGEDSLAVKHLAAAVWLLRSERPHVLVLEDDAWFTQHLAADLEVLLHEARDLSWGIIAVGRCYHHRTPFGQRARPHLWLTQIMPCAHAYLLSRSGAAAILATLPLQLPIDLQINTIAQDGHPYDALRRGEWPPPRPGSEIYWAEPPLAFQWPEDATRSVERL